MVQCPNCGGENSIYENYCDWCGKILPMSLRKFFTENALLFTIASLFAALSYYLLNLSKSLQTLSLSLNGSITGMVCHYANCSTSMNASYIGNISEISSQTPYYGNNPFILLPNIALIYGAIFSFIIFCSIILTICVNALKNRDYLNFKVLFILFSLLMLVALEFIFILDIYSDFLIFIALIFLIFFIFYIYFCIGLRFVRQMQKTNDVSNWFILYEIVGIAIFIVILFIIYYILISNLNVNPFYLGIVIIGLFFIGISFIICVGLISIILILEGLKIAQLLHISGAIEWLKHLLKCY